jgi:hypothetical protein
MASTREVLLQGVRDWIKAYATTAPLTDDQVIPADDTGGRPSVPAYFMVFISTHGVPVAMDETLTYLDAGSPVFDIQGERRSKIQVHAYGDLEEQLENLVASLHREDVIAFLTTKGITLTPPRTSGILAVPRMMNASREAHYVVEIDGAFRFRWGPFAAVHAENFQLDTEFIVPGGTSVDVTTTVSGLP